MTEIGHVGARVLIFERRASLASIIVNRLNSSGVEAIRLLDGDGRAGAAFARAARAGDIVVYSPLMDGARDLVPNLTEADQVLGECVRSGAGKIILLSSAAAYGAHYRNPGLIRESRPPSARCPNRVADAWRAVEALAERRVAEGASSSLTILRASMTVVEGATDWANRLFRRTWAVTVAGHNPSIQLLEATDLAAAIHRAVASDATGVFNIAPDCVVPLHHALRTAGVRPLPLPWTAQWLARAALRRLGLVSSVDQQEYLRYSWTVSNERSRTALAMCYHSLPCLSARTVESQTNPATVAPPQFDDFGMDEHFIRVRGRGAFSFMDRHYWRIEVSGLEHVPRAGRAILVGVHRGFMPFDGVMTVHLLEKHLGRIPRFLIHPGLVKFPVLAPFLIKLGALIACQENADRVLGEDEILGVFPEGIRGAFRMYRDAYTLDRFGRADFVKMALRNRAPIVPYVILGTAETFPILAKIEWSWWKRNTEWPFIPITPTFPLLPIPLPTKWHFQVLPPINVQEVYSSEAANDARIVSRISAEVRDRMQEVLDAMRRRRRSIFFGSIFDESDKVAGLGGLTAADRALTPASRVLEPTTR